MNQKRLSGFTSLRHLSVSAMPGRAGSPLAGSGKTSRRIKPRVPEGFFLFLDNSPGKLYLLFEHMNYYSSVQYRSRGAFPKNEILGKPPVRGRLWRELRK
jgi:hypothetical protein